MPRTKNELKSIPPKNHPLYIDKEDHEGDKRPMCQDERKTAEKCYARTGEGRCDVLTNTKFDGNCPFYKSNSQYLEDIKKYGNGMNYYAG